MVSSDPITSSFRNKNRTSKKKAQLQEAVLKLLDVQDLSNNLSDTDESDVE